MPATIANDMKVYYYIKKNIIQYVDTEALQRYGIPNRYDQSRGPFHDVDDVHWQRMKTELNITTSIRTLKFWANNNYLRGNPFNYKVKFGDFEFARGVEFLLGVGREQQLQRERLGINPIPERDREQPLPHIPGTPDVHIPIVMTRHYNNYSLENGTSEKEKLARAVLQAINGWKSVHNTTSEDKASARRQAELVFFVLRIRCGFIVKNDSYLDRFYGQLRSRNSDSNIFTNTFAMGAYHAVWKKEAGMVVEPHHLVGCNPLNSFKSSHESILDTKSGIVFNTFVGVGANATENILHVVKNSEEWMTKVANVAAKTLNKPADVDKQERIKNDEDCLGAPNCPFCPHKILQWLLSELHHFGIVGENRKKEIPGKNPKDYTNDELERQHDAMRLTCKFLHRVVTDMDKKYRKDDGSGHTKPFDGYKYEPSDRERSYLRKAVTEAMTEFLLSLDSHNRCLVTKDTELIKRFFNAFDYHHIFASANIKLQIGGKIFVIETKKTFQLSDFDKYISDETFSSLFDAGAYEVLKTRPLRVEDHALWHILYTNRDKPEVKPLFDMNWPFVEGEDGNFELVGDIVETLRTKFGLSVSDVESACDSEGYCRVPVDNVFLEVVERRRAKRAGGDDDEEIDGESVNRQWDSDEESEAPEEEDQMAVAVENEEDADMVDGNKSGEGESTAVESVAVRSDEDAVMVDVNNTTVAPVVAENEEDEDMTDDNKRGGGEDEDMAEDFAGDGDAFGENDEVSDEDVDDPFRGLTEEQLDEIKRLFDEWEERDSDEEVDHNEGEDDSDGGDVSDGGDDNEGGFDYNEGGDDNEVVDEGGDVNEGNGSNSTSGYDPLGPGNNLYVRDHFRNFTLGQDRDPRNQS